MRPENLNAKIGDLFLVECYDKDGNLKYKLGGIHGLR